METIAVPERVKTVMSMLNAAAERGDECPQNTMLAVAIGGESRAAGARIIALLETMNLIRVERGRTWRVVTIVSTGKSTRRSLRLAKPVPVKKPKVPSRTILRRERIDNLCDLIAEDVSVKDAAKIIGISEQAATSMMAEVRRNLGWQAC